MFLHLTWTITTEPERISHSTRIVRTRVPYSDHGTAVSSPFRKSAGCTIATGASRPDSTNYFLPLVAPAPGTSRSANPRIDGVLDLEPRQPLIAQAAARAGSSRLVALGFRTRYDSCSERIFSRDTSSSNSARPRNRPASHERSSEMNASMPLTLRAEKIDR
jgi:hypothetical protein